MARTRMDDHFDSEEEMEEILVINLSEEETPSSEGSSEPDEDMEDMESEMEELVIMDMTVWNNFPPDLHEHILQFVPIPDVCRFRTVCRAWNQVTTQLAFAAKARPQAKYIFKTPDAIGLGMGDGSSMGFNSDGDIRGLLRSSWELFDTSTQKFFPLSMEFLYAGVSDRFAFMDRCRTLAADKGFICVMWSSEDEEAIQVANPITRSVVELPPFNEDTEYMNAVASMVVADDFSAFTLYVVFDQENPPRHWRHCLRRFDSNVGEWRELGRPPGALTPTHALMLGETLFALFWDGVLQQLFAFDMARGAWSGTGVRLPHGVIIPQLATARGRLFFAGFGEEGVVILEVDVASTMCTFVASIDEEEDNDLFESMDCSTVYSLDCGTGANVVVVGCEDCLVLSSVNGGTVAFDLVDREWSEWEFDRQIANQDDISEERAGLYGMAMSLTLNPVPRVQLQIDLNTSIDRSDS